MFVDSMFNVELIKDDRSLKTLVFSFATLEEAQQFAQIAINHFVKDDDSGGKHILTVTITFKQEKSVG
jgi:hypothetical protein